MADDVKEGEGSSVEQLEKELNAAKELNKTRLEQLDIELKIEEAIIERQRHYIEELGNRSDLTEYEQELLDLAKEQVKTAENNRDLLTQQRDVLAEVKEEADALNDRYKDTIAYIDAMTIGWKKGFAGQILSSFKNLDKLGARLKRNLTFTNVAGSLAETMIQSTMSAVSSVSTLTAEMSKNTGQGTALNGVMMDVASSSRGFGVSFQESAAAVTALSTGLSDFTTMNTSTQAELATTVARLERFGVSAGTSAENIEIARKVMGMTTDQAVEMQNRMARLAAGIGEPAGRLAESFKAAAPQLAAHGGSMEKVFKNLAVTAKKTGVEMNELLGITKQFDTFEGAAQAAGKLNAILGGNLLNSTELLMASEDERLDMIRQSIISSGQSFDSMGRFQKMAVAQAAGISDMATANKLFSESQRASQEATDLNAVSQEELEKRQKASVDIQTKMTQAMEMFAVAVMPIVDSLNFLMNLVLGINDAFGGYLIPTLVGAVAISYALKGAIAAKNAAMAFNMTLTAGSTLGKMKEAAANAWNSYTTWLGVGAKTADAAATKTDTIETHLNTQAKGANSLAEGANTGAKMTGVGASGLRTAATNVEDLATKRLTISQRLAAVGERAWAATKYIVGGAANFIASALGFQTTAATASVAPNMAAAGGEVALGAGATAAVVPVGLLALALGILAFAAAILVTSILEFVKFLVEVPVRILYAVGAFVALAVGLSLVSIAMQFVSASAVMMGVGLLILISMMQTAIPLIPTFLAVMIALGASVGALSIPFTLFGLSIRLVASSIAKIAESIVSIGDAISALSASGLSEFGESISLLADDLKRLEESMSSLYALAFLTATITYTVTTAAGALFILGLGLGFVAIQMASIASSMEGIEDVNTSFSTVITSATSLTPDSVKNVGELVDQAERYTQSQIELKTVGSAFEGLINKAISAISPAEGEGEGKGQEIVLQLNEREFARAVMNSVDKKMKLNMA